MKQRYDVIIEPTVHNERKKLPGHIRQRIKRIISDLAVQPCPHDSEPLDVTDLDVPDGIELRRIKIARWRLVYAVHDDERWVWVWDMRERPPYDYDDLEDFTSRL